MQVRVKPETSEVEVEMSLQVDFENDDDVNGDKALPKQVCLCLNVHVVRKVMYQKTLCYWILCLNVHVVQKVMYITLYAIGNFI